MKTHLKLPAGYLFFFIADLVFTLYAWNYVHFALFLCTDDTLILNFFPPFVHPDYGDKFLVNPAIVYGLWIFFVIQIFLLPYLLTKKLRSV